MSRAGELNTGTVLLFNVRWKFEQKEIKCQNLKTRSLLKIKTDFDEIFNASGMRYFEGVFG